MGIAFYAKGNHKTTMRNRLFFVFSRIFRGMLAGLVIMAASSSFGTTLFTNNTTIGSANTNYEGADIVVSNCTLILDGPHGFSSLTVNAGGVVTYPFFPYGAIPSGLYVTNETQVLDGTNPVTLINPEIDAPTLTVADVTGTNFYVSGQDYLLTSPDGYTEQLEATTNSAIPIGATVLVSYETVGLVQAAGIYLTVTNNVQVDAGGSDQRQWRRLRWRIRFRAWLDKRRTVSKRGGRRLRGSGNSSSNAVGGACYGTYALATSLGSGAARDMAAAGVREVASLKSRRVGM